MLISSATWDARHLAQLITSKIEFKARLKQAKFNADKSCQQIIKTHYSRSHGVHGKIQNVKTPKCNSSNNSDPGNYKGLFLSYNWAYNI
jgi:hypothetical protein